jgi:hypothetical protein
MAFLRVDGVPLDTLIDSFDLKDASVEAWSRSVNNQLVGITYAGKYEVNFETPPLTSSDAAAWAGLLRGSKHLWTFERPDTGTTRWTPYSSDGGLVLSGGTQCSTTLFGSYGLLLGSDATSVATATFGSEGDWTVHFYHRPSAGSFVSYAVRSTAGVISAWANNASAATIRMVNPISVSSGYLGVTLRGRDAAGTAATSQFDAVSICRYRMTDQMLLSVASTPLTMVASGPAKAPYLTLTGEFLPKAGPAVNGLGEFGGRVFKGFVESFPAEPAVIGGVWCYDARHLKVRLTER